MIRAPSGIIPMKFRMLKHCPAAKVSSRER